MRRKMILSCVSFICSLVSVVSAGDVEAIIRDSPDSPDSPAVTASTAGAATAGTAEAVTAFKTELESGEDGSLFSSSHAIDETASSDHVHVHHHKSLRSNSHYEARGGFALDESDLELLELVEDDESASPISWPWNRNKTKPDKPDTSCHTYENCTSCTVASRACHWCAKDGECHAKGSWYGCAIGESCDAPKKNDTEDNSCHSHTDCAECTLSSSLCHWCAFDEQCHAIASIYGCSHGVNCYSNDRCRRTKPEHIDEATFDDVGFIPLFIIVVMTLGCLCCSSVLYAGASALKNAVDEITEVRVTAPVPGHNPCQGPVPGSTVQSPPPSMFRNNHYHEIEDGDDDDDDENNGHGEVSYEQEDNNIDIDDEHDCNGNGTSEEATLEHSKKKRPRSSSLLASDSHDDAPQFGNECGLERQSQSQSQSQSNHHQELLTEPLLPVTAHPDVTRLPTNTRRSNGHLMCLLRSCRVWYFFTIVTTLLLGTACILFFPKAPTYNVCSDQFAWKSIIDGLTSLKMEASFEILMSVENKNRLDVALENVGGTFRYDDEEVGTFTVRRSIIQASSITDVLVTCTVVPTKWEALGLISDYYKSKLVLTADMSGTVKIRGIGITIPIKLNNVIIKVNDPDNKDRHLCACPQWGDLKPNIAPVLPFEEAVAGPALENGMAVTAVKRG